MMSFPSRNIVEKVKKEYPKGTRVQLIHMEDPYRQMPEGIKGTVVAVDDTATIHVSWDNGTTLGVVYGEDSCKKIVQMPDEVVDQILFIRETGLTNMFDIRRVKMVAAELEMTELVKFLDKYKEEYANFILKGERG